MRKHLEQGIVKENAPNFLCSHDIILQRRQADKKRLWEMDWQYAKALQRSRKTWDICLITPN